MSELKELRKEKNLTQVQVAELLGVSLRSYKTYENDDSKVDTIKYKYLISKLKEINPIDEENGILSISFIKNKCKVIFDKYDVEYCYLFGSYAKGKAKGNSDIDLFISSKTSGLKYYGLIEELRISLHKKVDLLNTDQLEGNLELAKEILKDGIKIYGQCEK